MKHIIIIFAALLPLVAWAQVPSVDPTGTYSTIGDDGQEDTGDVNGQVKNAPLTVHFEANLSMVDGYGDKVSYRWTVTNTAHPELPALVRREADFTEVFSVSGSYVVELHATFYDPENENIEYEFPEEGEDPKIITFTISESKLEFPNAFSPNDDGKNDVLKPKEGWKSIVEFHAAVFNRWGQRLYSWDDVRGSWDGRQNGKTVKDGVYFLVVSAKGGDGVDYDIRKAITVISGYNKNAEGNGGVNE